MQHFIHEGMDDGVALFRLSQWAKTTGYTATRQEEEVFSNYRGAHLPFAPAPALGLSPVSNVNSAGVQGGESIMGKILPT